MPDVSSQVTEAAMLAQVLADRAPVPLCACRAQQPGVPWWINDDYATLFGCGGGGTVPARSPIDCAAICRTAGEGRCQTTGTHADGRLIPIQLTSRELQQPDGTIRICALVDLTELRRTEAALMAAERDAILGRIAGRVAHEVNNPLEAIKIYIEPLRNRVQDRPEVARGLTVIDQQVDRIARLVRGMLGLVQQRAVNRITVDVGEVVRTVSELFEPRFAKKGRSLILDVPSDLPDVSLDADAVQQVLINLLENAMAAAPVGGWVRVSAGMAAADLLRIEVSDNGPGLGTDPAVLFRPFYTTKANGTGLGLTVARNICRAHGGDLTAQSRPDGGASMTLTLQTGREATAGLGAKLQPTRGGDQAP